MDRDTILEAARERMRDVDSPNQLIGRSLTIGCAAVEITQRCNLDCKLCYLSEHSEQVADIPIEEVFKRLNAVRATYGPRTSVQITGGDPTLRKHDELVEIVAYARRIGLFPALFTNGIAASRKLLEALAAVGLCDVAFHVDTSQQRPGYDSEAALNVLRLEYLERTRGLGLMVIFNTTVHQGNFDELPSLVRFFTKHADDIGLASFQLQADTGRGDWKQRPVDISLSSVRQQIEQVVRPEQPWEVIRIGHPQCHSYLPTLVINGTLYPLIDDPVLFAGFIEAFSGKHADRRDGRARVLRHYCRQFLHRPRWIAQALLYAARFVWRARKDLLRARGRVHKLSFFVQNFMDSAALDQNRINACSFMVMTATGPVSMCQHNAGRDEFILQPIQFLRRDGSLGRYEPLGKRPTRRTSPIGEVA